MSVVLNGSKSNTRVSPATRERILEAAREMGYTPNVLARALRKSSTNILGLYFGYGHLEPHDPFHAEVLTGLQRGCEACNKDLMIHYSFHRYSVDEVFGELTGGKIDGVVLIAAPGDPLVSRVRGSNLPVIAMTDAIQGIPSIVADDAAGSTAIANHLHEKGHRTVLYRACPGESDSASRRQRAFEARASELGMTTFVGRTSDWRGRVEEAEADLIARRRELGITAAVCWGDPSAHALLAYCKGNRIAVPDELAIVGFNGIESPVEPAKVLTTVRAYWSNVAQGAVHLLVNRLEGREVPSLTVLPVEFSLGETS
ncbi:transcriptional regulator [Fimbriimonas ginsengisoli Gsoil 348]|uniref:Transcriptional regulator n=1 Tax=Fimbriimonas ginsengisoli Gsoil 348 TaxID=661478 RepID=A0A068NJY1_FIMGI|nr:transcriptional regulator [Fimbriimonas ginsengisoli Gsoil 348]